MGSRVWECAVSVEGTYHCYERCDYDSLYSCYNELQYCTSATRYCS
ncbi:MAG: hypothetical protein M5U28_51650 [Sandaracinaceae bacterium]|nr:hypothetical protein [Sandaracinaceae bacterium]